MRHSGSDVALCTSRQGPLLDNAYTGTRPPVGLRLRDSFLFVNGFSLVWRRRSTPLGNARTIANCLGELELGNA